MTFQVVRCPLLSLVERTFVVVDKPFLVASLVVVGTSAAVGMPFLVVASFLAASLVVVGTSAAVGMPFQVVTSSGAASVAESTCPAAGTCPESEVAH